MSVNSDEDIKSNIKIEEEDYEIKSPPKKKIRFDEAGAFKRIVEKYPMEKDGKTLQVHCKLCCEVFKSILAYRDHFLENHARDEDDKQYCKKCEMTFENRKTLLEHFRLVHENFNCTMCKRQFASEHQLNEHLNCHENSDSKVMCNFCGKIYASQINLNFHIDAMHKEIRFYCDMCEKSYSFKSALYKHRLVSHIRGRTVKCPECPFLAGTKHEVRLHMNNHHNLARNQTRSDIVCGHCGMQFHNGSTLKRHNFHMHGGFLMKYKHKCTLCEEPLKGSSKAERHMIQTHLNGERPLRKCGYCKVEIKLYNEYKQHIEMHEGVFICITCGDAHFTPEQLSAHQKMHNRIEVKLRPYACDICGHRTVLKNNMEIHMTKHIAVPDLHTCEVCGKGFKIRSSLYTHRLYHNDPTIPCSLCSKKFHRNTELQFHIRKEHTMEKPHK